MRSITRNMLIVLWAAAFLAGGYALILRFMEGHRPAAYGSYVVWGLGVAQYIYFVGISAGAFMLATVTYGFGVKRLEAVGRPALLVSAAGLVAGLLSIWTDLGHMGRAFLVLVRPNFSSMMTWMIWLYVAYAILLGLMGYAIYKKSPRVKLLALIGIPLVVSFSGGVGALFATVAAKPLWNSSLYPVFFLVGALLSASGLLIALLALQAKQTPAVAESIATLSRILLGLLLVEMILEWAEYSVALWYSGGEHAAVTEVLFGSYWWVFWGVHLLLGMVVPAGMLLLSRGSRAVQALAGLLVVLSYLAVRLNIVIPGQITPELKGLEMAYVDPRLTFSYYPSLFEWGILLFCAAVAIGLLWLGYRFLPLTADHDAVSRKEAKVA